MYREIGETNMQAIRKRGRVYVEAEGIVRHIEALARDYNNDGQQVVGRAYEILARDLREDLPR